MFEGEEDEEFYSNFLLERFPQKKFKPIICDGKGGVFALSDTLFDKFGNKKNVFFFIDTDHDKILGIDDYPENFFSTCGYSVENYFFDEEIIMSGIKKYFQINPSDEILTEISNLLKSDRNTFEGRFMAIMAFAVELRKKDHSPELKNLKFNTFFEYKNLSLKKKNVQCEHLLHQTKINLEDEFSVWRSTRDVRKMDTRTVIRGKYCTQFILNFIRHLPEKFQNREKSNGKPLKQKVELGNNNLISLFAEFVELPERLSTFMDKMEFYMPAN
ncbi:DUF4435 domain-containing protein [Nisaea sp.]|uniref:DUF4435 domain-containing protein n=1 Tax=Nisaea sp. TaxID=2024842 RepID=UPI003299C459